MYNQVMLQLICNNIYYAEKLLGCLQIFLEDFRSLSAGPEKGYVNLLLGLRALALLRSTSTLFFIRDRACHGLSAHQQL